MRLQSPNAIEFVLLPSKPVSTVQVAFKVPQDCSKARAGAYSTTGCQCCKGRPLTPPGQSQSYVVVSKLQVCQHNTTRACPPTSMLTQKVKAAQAWYQLRRLFGVATLWSDNSLRRTPTCVRQHRRNMIPKLLKSDASCKMSYPK